MKKPILLIASLAILNMSPQPVRAANPLFDGDAPLNAVLSAPITRIYKDKKQDVRKYYESNLTYKTKEGKSQKLDLKVRTEAIFDD